VLVDKYVFAGFPGGKLIAVSADNGAPLWEGTVALPKGATELDRVADVTSVPVIDGRMICAGRFPGAHSCFDLGNGNLIWSRDISSGRFVDRQPLRLRLRRQGGRACPRQGERRQALEAGQALPAPADRAAGRCAIWSPSPMSRAWCTSSVATMALSSRVCHRWQPGTGSPAASSAAGWWHLRGADRPIRGPAVPSPSRALPMKPSIVLVGRPNVGKSTLFNRLTRTRDALVADIPGLTRDRHYGHGRLGSKPYLVIDTGGFEPLAKDGIMHQMARQTEQAIDEADVVILVVDGRSGVTALDKEIANRLRQSGRPVLVAVNKAEGMQHGVVVADFHELGLGEPVAISATHGEGVRALIDLALEPFPEPADEEVRATSSRWRSSAARTSARAR
jgi:small GTP-binding protein